MEITHIAIVGCQGIPVQYGGYETLVEYLAEYKPDNVDITVYCSACQYKKKLDYYKGVKLRYINIPSNGIMSCFYDMYSILLSVLKYDKILVLGNSGGFIMPFLFPFRNKFFLNIGGVEWARSKYSPLMQIIIRFLMWVAVKSSAYLIADNKGIKEYIKEEYNRDDAVVIAYGGDQAKVEPITEELRDRYKFLNNDYAIAIARIQPDNNVEMILDAFKDLEIPLVYIGNWNVSEWAKNTREKYSVYKNLILLDAIYNVNILNVLRGNCSLYIHGHSAGGTNPSLVEAMHLNVPLACYANVFNRYATYNRAYYFNSSSEIIHIVKTLNKDEAKSNAINMKLLAMEHYTWKKIAQQYYSFIVTTKL